MPSIGQTWVLASIGDVVEMGILSALKRLLMESNFTNQFHIFSRPQYQRINQQKIYIVGVLIKKLPGIFAGVVITPEKKVKNLIFGKNLFINLI
jgi:hypothetical protein